MYFVGRGQGALLFEGRLSFTFWAFWVGAYSKWVLIRRWAVYCINMANCQEGFLECKSIGAMPVKEYSCTINLGFLLKCVTTRAQMLEAWLALTWVKYHDNLGFNTS